MKEKKNIDKLFKEQFKDFEVSPKDSVWENIEAELHQKERKKRRIIPIWWRVAGVAAALALIFAVASQFINPTENSILIETVESNNGNESTSEKDLDASNIIDPNDSATKNPASHNDLVNSEETTEVSEGNATLIEENKEANSLTNKPENGTSIAHDDSRAEDEIKNINTSENSVQSSNAKERKPKSEVLNLKDASTKDAIAKSNKQTTPENNDSEVILKNESEIKDILKSTNAEGNVVAKSSGSNNNSGTENSTVENSNIEDQETQIPDPEQENAIEKAIAEAEATNEDEELEEEAQESKRWSVSPNVAPVYFSSLGEGSSIDDQFIGNSKESEINMSYGVTGSYAVGKKLKIRAGINRVDMGYSTNDVLIFENGDNGALARRSDRMPNVNMAENLGRYSIFSADNFDFARGPASLYVQEQGSIDQQLGFIEVPIELEYSLLEKKFGLNVIGGFSTLFLSQNDLFAVLDSGERTRLGDASNVRDLSYTANFGIGIDYNFTKQLQFNFEPTFKYQINTFSNTSGDFQPFFIGMYTGLSFKF